MKSDLDKEQKRLSFIYASRRRLQRNVLNFERRIAQAIHVYTQTNHLTSDFGMLCAYLSCWKFSKTHYAYTDYYWCDAIYLEEIQIKNNKTLIFNGHAWIGLASNTCNEWKIPVSGEFSINARGKKLKQYTLIFYNANETLVLSK